MSPKSIFFFLFTVCLGTAPARALSPLVEFQDLVAGQGERSFSDGPFYSAQFNHPLGLALSPDGTALYVADELNNRIRVIRLDRKNEVGTLAGTGEPGRMDGPCTAASFNHPSALAVLPDGRIVVNDKGNSLLRLIDPASGSVTTLAGGVVGGPREGEASKLTLAPIWNLAYFEPDHCLYFSQPWDGALRRLNLQKGLAETVLKDNPTLPHPAALCVAGGKLFVSDSSLPQVFQVQIAAANGKSEATPGAKPPPVASVSVEAVGQAHQVLALAGSGKSLYAYQADPKAPLQRILPQDAPVSFLSVWGTHLTHPDPGTILLHFQNVASVDPVGFVPDPRSPERFFFTNPFRSIVCSWRDMQQAYLASFPGEDTNNSAGIHDFEYPPAKPPGVFRILLIGRSYIYWTDDDRRFEGPGFEGEDTKFMNNLAKQMELSLNTLSALEDMPCRFEVLNAGMHHDADNEINVFSYYVVPPLVKTYDVDLVMVMQDEVLTLDAYLHKPLTSEGIPSDKVDPEFLLRPYPERFKPGPWNDFLDLCKAKKLLVTNNPKFWTFTDMNDVIADRETRPALAGIVGKPLQLLKEKIHSMDSPGKKPRQLVLCYFPITLNSSKDRQSFWGGVCEKNGIPFLDLCDDFTAVGYSFYPYQPWESGHFTVNGMRLFSTIMVHELMRRNLVPAGAGGGNGADQAPTGIKKP